MILRMPRTALFLVFCLFAVLPLVSHAAPADTQASVRAAVMTELLQDPRTATIPPDQLSVLVDALTAQAQAQNVTAADILWHPQSYRRASPVAQAAAEYFAQCDASFMMLCPFNIAFGFAGTDSNLPAWLFILSAIMVLLIPRIRHECRAKSQ